MVIFKFLYRCMLVLLLTAPIFVATADGVAGSGWLGSNYPKLFAKGDPTLEMMEWGDARSQLAARGLLGRSNLYVLATSWRDGTFGATIEALESTYGAFDPADVLFADDDGCKLPGKIELAKAEPPRPQTD